jgi:hypothetical protein
MVGVRGGENKKRSATEEEASRKTELAGPDETTVAALRSVLAGRFLGTSGEKRALVGRLKEAI